jgi:hypothetical protein
VRRGQLPFSPVAGSSPYGALLAGLLDGVPPAVGAGCSSELPGPVPMPKVPEEPGDPVPAVLLGLGEVVVGAGVGVEAGAVDAVAVGVAEAHEVGAGEAAADAVGLVPVPACVVGQVPDPRPPLPDEMPPMVMSCGERVAEAVGVAVPLPPPGESLALAVGVTGSQSRQGAGAAVTPGPAVDPDGTVVLRTPDPVLADAPLTAPARRPGPLALLGPAPRLGATAWVPLVSTVEPTSTKAARTGGTATVTAVTVAAAARPAASRIHVRPCGRVTDRSDRDAAPGTSQACIPDRHRRPHQAAARREARARQAVTGRRARAHQAEAAGEARAHQRLADRRARAHQAVARRQVAATRATSAADRHSPDRQ